MRIDRPSLIETIVALISVVCALVWLLTLGMVYLEWDYDLWRVWLDREERRKVAKEKSNG